MKKLTFITLILTLLATSIVTAPVMAQDAAAAQPWTSNIWYFNPTDVAGTFTINYYVDASEGTSSADAALAAYKSGVVHVADISGLSTGSGSAVISSDRPIQAVYEQLGNPDKNGRSLYTAFSSAQAGQRVYIPSFVNVPASPAKMPYVSVVGVQNVTTGDVNVTATFYSLDGTITTKIADAVSVPSSKSLILNASTLPAGSNGSLVIEATGNVVAAAQEQYYGAGPKIYSFEGVSVDTAATTIKFPMAGCKAGGLTTYIFVQNTQAIGGANATITTSYVKGSSGAILKKKKKGAVANYVVQPGHGAMIDLCKEVPSGTPYTATLTSDQPIAAILKTTGTYNTAVTGQSVPAAAAQYQVVIPYVTWASSAKGYRTTLYVENIGTASVKPTVTFYRDDSVVGAAVVKPKTLAAIKPGAVKSITPSAAKALTPSKKAYVKALRNTFAGAVIVTSTQPIIVRMYMNKTSGGKYAEEYLGIPYIAE